MLKRALLIVDGLLLVAIVSALRIEPSVEWSIAPDRIAHQAGYAYFVDLRGFSPAFGYELKGDTNEHPRRSTLTLLRDGQPLGPPHTVHDIIAKKGGGALSH